MAKTLAPSDTVTVRDSKGRKLVSIVEAAYDKARLSQEEAQRVNDTPGLSDLVASFIAENRCGDKFKDEEVKSAYTYPSEYKVKSIKEQVSTAASIFGLDPASALTYAKSLPGSPDGAEGWFAVPSLTALVKKHFFDVNDPAEQYCRAVQLVHEKLAASRSFYNYRAGEITPQHLRQSQRAGEFWQQVEAQQQENDIKIIAAQLGLCHRGCSVRRARIRFVANEFGLGSLSVGSIILVHPERLVRYDELDIDCPGDEYAPDAVGRFSRAPCFFFSDGRVGFDARGVGGAYGYYGSASGFLAK